MAIDRNQITRLTALNPVERHHISEDPSRSPASDGMDEARQGFHTLSRANPTSVFNRNRPVLTPPVRLDPNIDYDETNIDHIIY